LFFSMVSVARKPTTILFAVRGSVLVIVKTGSLVLTLKSPFLPLPSLLTVQSLISCLGILSVYCRTILLESSFQLPFCSASEASGFSCFRILIKLSMKSDWQTNSVSSSGALAMSLRIRS
jgi:hypothetical protein